MREREREWGREEKSRFSRIDAAVFVLKPVIDVTDERVMLRDQPQNKPHQGIGSSNR